MSSRYSKTPEIFTTIPPQPKEKKPGQLSPEQLKQYFEKGYVLIPEFFTKEELQPAIDDINALVDGIANKLYKAGKIKNKHEGASFYDRLTLLDKEFPGAAILLHKKGVLPEGFQGLWSNERLLNIVEQLIGPEIAGHPVWNLRTKVPKNEGVTVPWHQDNAYLADEANEVLMPTAWVPLIDATKKTGCLEMIQEGHKKGFLAKHFCCAGPTHYVEMLEETMIKELDVDMEKDVVLCEVPMGGVLLFNNLIPHRSLQNFSDQVRWSLDLRWCAPDKDNAFYGLKESILMRTAKDPDYKIDWDSFAKVSIVKRLTDDPLYNIDKTKQDARQQSQEEAQEEDDIELRIVGPWMGRWELLHYNRHTERYLAMEKEEAAAQK